MTAVPITKAVRPAPRSVRRDRREDDAISTDPFGELAAAEESEGVQPSGPASPFAWTSAGELARRAPREVPWLVPDLQIARGRPTLLYGDGGTGKTLIAMSAAIAIAAGLDVWARFPVARRAPTRLVDLEIGALATEQRTRRVAAGMGLSLEELGDDFQTVSHPPFSLVRPDAEEILCRAFDGVAFVVFDALRGLTRGIDENDARVRDYVDVLARVSERTGCAFLFVHHSGKSGGIRGTSAIWDAAGCVYRVQGGEGSPKTITHEKPSELAHGLVERVAVEFVDLDEDGTLVAVADGPGQPVSSPAPIGGAANASREERVLAALGAGPLSKWNLRQVTKITRTERIDAALETLASRGLVVERGNRWELSPKGGSR